MQALWVAACPDEAPSSCCRVLMDTAGSSPEHPEGVHIMYGIGGEHDLAERELSHLEGWRSSQPVRIGNAAWEQTQHDTYGVLLDAVHCYRDQLDGLDPSMKQFVIALVNHTATIWNEPDQGIWEIPRAARHHLHSTLMCWVALDRGIRLARPARRRQPRRRLARRGRPDPKAHPERRMEQRASAPTPRRSAATTSTRPSC